MTTLRRLLIVTLILVAAVFVSVPLVTSARWSGRFTLRIDLNLPSGFQRASLTYLECWDGDTAHWICERRAGIDKRFKPASRSTADADYVRISSGGTSNALRIFDTYHHPKFLIIQYRSAGDVEAIAPRCIVVPIPPGKGDRSIFLDLTQAGR